VRRSSTSGDHGGTRLRLLVATVVAALGLAAFVVAAAVRTPPGAPSAYAQPAAGAPYRGALIPEGVPAPAFALRDERGRHISRGELLGRPAVVIFASPVCRETCPLEAEVVRGALDRMGRPIPAIAVSVDPPRDTPAAARSFLRRHHLSGRMRFVLGTAAQLQPIWRGFAVDPTTAAREHQARIVLLDAAGRQRVGYMTQWATPEALAHDLRLLLREARG